MTKAIHRMAFRPAAAVATLWSSTPMVGLRSLMLLRLMIAAEMGVLNIDHWRVLNIDHWREYRSKDSYTQSMRLYIYIYVLSIKMPRL